MKKFNEKFVVLVCLLFIFIVSMGAKVGDNNLRVGTETGSDIEIQMGDGALKWNDAAGKMQISDDGVGFLSISDISGNDSSSIENATVATSVATSALTIDLKISDGSTDPSGGSQAKAAFRDSVVTDGAYNIVPVSSALTIVIPSGATLGHLDGTDGFIYVYLLDNSGVLELAISSTIKDESNLQTSVTIDTSSDDDDFYSTTGRSNVPIRLIARLKSNQVTAGTWDLDVIENSPGPHIFTDIDTRLNKKIELSPTSLGRMRLAVASILHSGTPAIQNDYSGTEVSWIDNMVDNGLGNTTINFTANIWDGVAVIACSCTCRSANRTCIATVGTANATVITSSGATAAAEDRPFVIYCWGVKGTL